VWYALLGYEVVTMKQIYREISHPAFPYCKKHNRLFPHYSVGWLTPIYPEKLETFQAECDICKAEKSSPLFIHKSRIPA